MFTHEIHCVIHPHYTQLANPCVAFKSCFAQAEEVLNTILTESARRLRTITAHWTDDRGLYLLVFIFKCYSFHVQNRLHVACLWITHYFQYISIIFDVLSCLFFNINENKMHTVYSDLIIRQIDMSFNKKFYVFDVYSPHVFVIFSSMHVSSSPRPILAASKGRGI